jgi:hypothetical protein
LHEVLEAEFAALHGKLPPDHPSLTEPNARLKAIWAAVHALPGGGYIGSWLSAWIKNDPQGIDGVVEELRRRPDSTQSRAAVDSSPAGVQ